MALLFNPVRRDELFDSGTGKIKDTLIPDIAAVGDAVDITFDPTGREFAPESTNVDLALVEAINRVKTLEDAGGGGGGTSAINRNIINYTQLVNLPDYIGQWIQITNILGTASAFNKKKIQISFNATGSITVDLKLTDNGGSNIITYFKDFATVNAEATVNLTTGVTLYNFIVDQIIEAPANGMVLYMKVNNANLADTLKILDESSEVTLTSNTVNASLPAGL